MSVKEREKTESPSEVKSDVEGRVKSGQVRSQGGGHGTGGHRRARGVGRTVRNELLEGYPWFLLRGSQGVRGPTRGVVVGPDRMELRREITELPTLQTTGL